MLSTLVLLKLLIARPSITPNDAGCQDVLLSYLKNAGFNYEKLPMQDVQNFWAWHGNTKPLIILAGHTDVVPSGNEKEWHSPPFIPTIRGEYLYGRGAADMKGGLSAIEGGMTDGVRHTRQIELANVNIPSTYYASLTSEQFRIGYDLYHRVMQTFVGMINQNVNRPAFTEAGNSGFELAVDKATYHSFRSQMGLMIDIPLPLIRLFMSGTWEHELAQNQTSFNARFISINSDTQFLIRSAQVGRDLGLIKGGLVLAQKTNWKLFALYVGQFAQHWQANGGRLQLDIRF